MRNDPCPCGSGKKYKKCHGSVVPIALQQTGDLRRDEFRQAALAKDADMRLHVALLEWGDRVLPPDWLEEALAAYVGAEEGLDDEDDVTPYEENVWLTWSLHHRPLGDGCTLAERFVAEPDRARRVPLSALDRAVLDAHRRASLTLWRVVRIEHGIGSELEDLLSSSRVFVYDAASTENMQPDLVVLAYVLDVGGVHFFGGMHQQPLTPWHARSLLAKVQQYIGDASECVDADDLASWQSELCALYGDTIVEMQEHAVPSMLSTPEGHPLEPTVDRFDVLRTLPTMRKALRAIPGVSISERVEEGERYVLVDADPVGSDEPPSAFGPSVLAELLLLESALLVSSNSVARADRVRSKLEVGLGARIRHVEREVTSSAEVMDRFRAMAAEREQEGREAPARTANRDGIYIMPDDEPDTPDLPPEVQAAIGERMAAESRRWVELRIPALDHQTPREAVRNPRLRPKLVALLDDMAFRSRGLASWQTMDVGLIRRELGLQ